MAASRAWICVRPATYESAAEAELLLGLLRPRDGVLRNTVFCLFDSKGQPLTRSGRSPQMIFDDASAMAATMRRALAKHEPTEETPALPEVGDVRLGLNLAACDGLPLVVGVARNAGIAAALRTELARISLTDPVIGRAHYVVLSEREPIDELLEVTGAAPGQSVLVLLPDAFGQAPELLLATGHGQQTLPEALARALRSPEIPGVPNDSNRHVREGKRRDIEWESEIPVTDGRGARESGRR